MKIALVTGENRVLGFENSRQLAKNGFKVYMGVRSPDKGTAAADILRSEGLKVEAIAMDVTKTQSIRDFVNFLREKNESLDVIVNNAGVFLESEGPTDNSTASVFKVDPVIILKTIETNTMGPLRLLQALIPIMQAQENKDGRIINISSGMGSLNEMGGYWPGYRMSKTALNALTKIMAAELSETNIKVNSVCPGWVKTDMGGKQAPRSVEEGVQTTIWLATTDKCPNGGFFRDKKEISW
jgi:NAD(P)-dependent dehydrogenase (short-subunit alcohol dehydrogenase family)